jgi:hypothetical protein
MPAPAQQPEGDLTMTTVADSTHGTVRLADGRRWTEQAVRSLGMTTDVETAGAILGIGRTKAYEPAQAGSSR